MTHFKFYNKLMINCYKESPAAAGTSAAKASSSKTSPTKAAEASGVAKAT